MPEELLCSFYSGLINKEFVLVLALTHCYDCCYMLYTHNESATHKAARGLR